MQHSENNDPIAVQFIAQLVPTDHEATNIASIEPIEPGPDPRQRPQSCFAADNFPHSLIRRPRINRSQELVQALQIA